MKQISVPTREQVSPNNQAIFDNLKNAMGFVPNLYATYAHNETALGDYLTLQNRKTTLTAIEREVINLVVSQVNDCKYCVPAHTAIAKMYKLTDEQILEIRKVEIPNDKKLDALAKAVKEITISKGKPSAKIMNTFFEVGYDEANLVDVVMTIGDKIISNYFHGITQVPVDFPEVPQI
jgi:uncharacterized peroxidase-related enzyme